MKEKTLINEIQTLRKEIVERSERTETGNKSREAKNHNDYYNLLFNKLTKEEREIVFAAEYIAYFDGVNAALNGVELSLENIFTRNEINTMEEKRK